MEKLKVFDSELKVMNIVWENEPVTAKEVSVIAERTIGWNKNTTYTIIKKLIEKNAILRSEPGFMCTSLVKREEVLKTETEDLIEKLFKGSRKAFFASFIEDSLSKEDIEELKELIDKKFE